MTDTNDRRGRHLRDLRISVIDRCNFRCPYCMPKETFHQDYQFLPPEDYLSFPEITRVAQAFVRLGVSKLRVTGGEPLLRPRLPELIERLARLPGVTDLALTTNGYLLPRQAASLRSAGLQRVTVSLDSMDKEVFARMSGLDIDINRVLEGIEAARSAGLTPVKLNAVVQRAVNDHTVVDLVRYFRGTGVTVRFIEYMDVGNRNGWSAQQVVSSSELRALIGAEFPLEQIGQARGEVASRYRFKDGEGEIGFISSVSAPFCGDCTRARLSTDGKVFTCLFASHGTDLRGLLRGAANDRELTQAVSALWSKRTDQYSEERSRVQEFVERKKKRKVEMYQIGG